ncbi:MAG: glyoxylate/hydroxypyruvate reductase A [Alphaproteobacteria bacterium]|jgi:glyoxylate/hydroxypyruvate reductase|nr:glyoxylate/hydroxypyruvate reductase A [Alphaproteobacteria bacterium]
MAILFFSEVDDPDEWRQAFAAQCPDMSFRVWPDIGDPADIEVALVWHPPDNALDQFPNLRLIASLGAGVDHLFRGTGLPVGIPVSRIVDRSLTEQMVEYVVLGTLFCHRQMPAYMVQQKQANWQLLRQPLGRDRRVGVLGLGELGMASARALKALQFDVAGWSRSPKNDAEIPDYVGTEGLKDFLARTDILVCLLPLTPQTEGLLNAAQFARLPHGASFVNAGRGGHVVEGDLLAALDSGQLNHAMLDVFQAEPLPAESPFWSHPGVTLTPHVASITNASSGTALVLENLQRVRAGDAPLYEVVPSEGY